MKQHDVKGCAAEDAKLYPFSGSVIYREDLSTPQPVPVHQNGTRWTWCVPQTVLMVGRSVLKRFGRRVDPRDGLESEWVQETVCTQGALYMPF
jgi:hypothetical protein